MCEDDRHRDVDVTIPDYGLCDGADGGFLSTEIVVRTVFLTKGRVRTRVGYGMI